jgi:hypothetical protein
MQAVSSSIPSTNTMNFKLNGYQNTTKLFDVSISSTQTVDPTSNKMIQTPSSYITIQDAIKLLEPVFGNSLALDDPDGQPTEEIKQNATNPDWDM